MNPKHQMFEYGNSLVLCDDTVGHILNSLMTDIPSAIEEISCSLNACFSRFKRNVQYVTFQINKEGDIGELQQFLDQRAVSENMNCGQNCIGTKHIYTTISKINLFIDILYWEGIIQH